LFAVLAGGSVWSGCAQNIRREQVPSVVFNAFAQQFPEAVDIEWEKHRELYNVEFEIGKADHELWLDDKGTFVRHEEEVEPYLLPQKVQERLRTDFAGAETDDAWRITEGNNLYYLVELESWPGDKHVRIHEDGTVAR